MALLRLSRLVLVVAALLPRPSAGCPAGCRCYSLTVECGSLGVKEIPQDVPSVTEVSPQNWGQVRGGRWGAWGGTLPTNAPSHISGFCTS